MKEAGNEIQKARAFRIGLMLVFALAITLIPLNVCYGVTACPSLVSYEQPDGTVIQYRVRGDERVNWKESKDGSLILMDKRTGYFCYANRMFNHVYKSGARVGIDKKPLLAAPGTGFNAVSAQGLSPSERVPQTGIGPDNAASLLAPISVPSTQPVLVLLINFTNVSSTAPAGFWKDAFFSDSVSSVNKYFKEVSYGATRIVPVVESAGTANDGVVRVNLPREHPAVLGYTAETDLQIPNLVRSALAQANAYVDFSDYDLDHDGAIGTDELHISAIFAGGEAAVGGLKNSIWAHSWGFEPLVVDGTAVESYIATGENFVDSHGDPDLSPMSIGVVCHELAHSMGLPDLYDYGYDAMGIGDMSLMGSGTWGSLGGLPGKSPVHLDAWSKIALGFVTPVDGVLGTEYTLNEAGLTNYNVLKVADPANPDQYFLLENRGTRGYDYGLMDFFANEGVAIYHVDEEVMRYAASNPDTFPYFNDNRFRKAVDVEEANQGIAKLPELDYFGYDALEYINPWPQPYRGYTFFSAADDTRYNNMFTGTTTPASGFYANPVDESIVPPLIFDETTQLNWYFETDASIGAQTDPSGFFFEVVDVPQDAMRVRLNLQSYMVRLTALPAAGGILTGGGSLIKDSTAALLASAKPGYAFSHWIESGSGSILSEENPYVASVTGPMNLTAVFTPNNYTIAFNPNGGSGSMPNLAMSYGAYKYLDANTFVRSGYVFDGWSLTPGGTMKYRDKEGVANVTTEQGGVVTLYARWKLNVYGIGFNANGATSGTMSVQSITYETTTALAANGYRKTGYSFLGWSTTATGPVVYKDKAAVKNLTATNGETINLYAKWGPPILSATSYGYTGIKVSWAAAGNATSYRIYRATSPGGTYSLVYTASSTARSWVDTGRTTGKYYYYKVNPMIGTKAYVHSAYRYAKAIPSTPTTTVTKYATNSIKVAWTGITGATKYQVYRATSLNGTYYLVYTGTATARSWVNTGRPVGATYYYQVRACHLEGSTYVYGNFSAVKSIRL